jgi:hypothetical protein
MTRTMLALAVLVAWTVLPTMAGEEVKADPDAEAKAKIPGLKLWYKLDESEGAKAKNAVEKGTDGELEGAKWAKEGKFGGALSLNGESYLITAASVGEAFTEGSVTIAVWIKPKSGGVVADELGQHNINDGWHDSQIELMDDGELKVRVWQLDGLSIGKVKMDEWHHVALRYNSKTSVVDGFVDGVKCADKIEGEKQWNNGGDIYYAFGCEDSTNLGQGGYYKGLMDDIRVYNRPLTDEEMKVLAGVKK